MICDEHAGSHRDCAGGSERISRLGELLGATLVGRVRFWVSGVHLPGAVGVLPTACTAPPPGQTPAHAERARCGGHPTDTLLGLVRRRGAGLHCGRFRLDVAGHFCVWGRRLDTRREIDPIDEKKPLLRVWPGFAP
jgi:hypothetical protein